jgi:hypothetical protein
VTLYRTPRPLELDFAGGGIVAVDMAIRTRDDAAAIEVMAFMVAVGATERARTHHVVGLGNATVPTRE